jgi:hypothetical protein
LLLSYAYDWKQMDVASFDSKSDSDWSDSKPVRTVFYKTNADQNCLETIEAFYANGHPHEKICMRFAGAAGVTEKHFMNFHAYMDRSPCWSSVSSWKTVVTYVIQSGEDFMYVRDTDHGQLSELFTHKEGDALHGTSRPGGIPFSIHRYTETPFALSTNVKNYKWVIIESKRTFCYESASSSWGFNCAVTWEGESKALAEASDRKFCISIDCTNVSKFFGNVGYGCASMCEKILDVVGRERGATLEFNVT